jgi:hypothetical protein
MKNIKRIIKSPCPGNYFTSLSSTRNDRVSSMRNIIQDSIVNSIWSPIRAITKRVIKNKL